MANDPGALEGWVAVDRYLADLLLAPDPVLDAALEANAAAGLPPHDVSAMQGKLLFLLARLAGARSVLEIGTLGGYSTIWLARGVAANGRVVTLEIDPAYADVAFANLRLADLAERVEVRVGPALDSLDVLIAESAGPFDLIFIDADKPNNPGYLRAALELSRPGTAIIGDNVVREGAVVDADSGDQRVQGVRAFHELLATEPRIDATTIQTVGAKGYDGFTLALVTGSSSDEG